MNYINTKWYSWLIMISDYILLSVLWVISSVFLVTIYPATVAMFSTLKYWKINEITGEVIKTYLLYLKKELIKKSFISLIFLVLLTSSILLSFSFLKITNILELFIVLVNFLSRGMIFLTFFVSSTCWNNKENEFNFVEFYRKIINKPFNSMILILVGNILIVAILIQPYLFTFVGVLLILIYIALNYGV